jgi:putative inorganic carbon (HCO3(-)) transporter
LRDYLVLAIILSAAPLCFFYPYFGVLMWSWIAYFNPHRYAYGIAQTFPVALVIAVPTLIGTIFTKGANRRVMTRETVLLLFYWLWMGVTVINAFNEPIFADHLTDAVTRLVEISKIMLMTILTCYLVTTKQKLKYLLMVTAFSLGILAVKGTIFGILTGGQFRVWGPPKSFIADNNDFGLAVNMTLPMLFFLGRDEENRRLKMLFRFTFICGVVAVLLTYSRGALLGLIALLAAIAFKSHYKLISASLLVITMFLVISFAPPAWMDRMGNFAQGNLDESAQERITSWAFAWNLAKHYPLTGAGFECFTPNLFAIYSDRDPATWLAGHTSSGPHSIYFQVLAEQGFVGLLILFGILGSCIVSARKMRRRVANIPSMSWIANYSHIVEVSLLAYMVSGAFLGRAYFDLFLQIVAILIALKLIYKKEMRATLLAYRESPDIQGQIQLRGILT